jgi:hypothetical protein
VVSQILCFSTARFWIENKASLHGSLGLLKPRLIVVFWRQRTCRPFGAWIFGEIPDYRHAAPPALRSRILFRRFFDIMPPELGLQLA